MVLVDALVAVAFLAVDALAVVAFGVVAFLVATNEVLITSGASVNWLTVLIVGEVVQRH